MAGQMPRSETRYIQIFKIQNKSKKIGSVVKMEYLVGDLNYTILDRNI